MCSYDVKIREEGYNTKLNGEKSVIAQNGHHWPGSILA